MTPNNFVVYSTPRTSLTLLPFDVEPLLGMEQMDDRSSPLSKFNVLPQPGIHVAHTGGQQLATFALSSGTQNTKSAASSSNHRATVLSDATMARLAVSSNSLDDGHFPAIFLAKCAPQTLPLGFSMEPVTFGHKLIPRF